MLGCGLASVEFNCICDDESEMHFSEYYSHQQGDLTQEFTSVASQWQIRYNFFTRNLWPQNNGNCLDRRMGRRYFLLPWLKT